MENNLDALSVPDWFSVLAMLMLIVDQRQQLAYKAVNNDI